MAVKNGMKKTSRRGVFFREHPTRKNGIRKDRQFILRYYISKKECTEVFGWESDGKTELDAERKLAELKANAKSGNGPTSLTEEARAIEETKRRDLEALRLAEEAKANRCNFNKLFEKYLENKGEYKTARTDKTNFNKHISPVIGKKYPDELIPADVDQIRISMMKTHQPQTVKHILQLIVRLTAFGVKKHYCTPLSFEVELPKVENEKTEDLTSAELKKYLEAIDSDSNFQVRSIIKMALYTGMRRSEILKLKWEDVNFERGHILLRDPKGLKDETIPLNQATRKVLDEVKIYVPPVPKIKKMKKSSEQTVDITKPSASIPVTASGYIFPGRNGNRRHDLGKSASRIRDAAGLTKDFRPLHGLRHHFGSMLASSGEVDLYTLQKLLTHKSPEMTARYAHLRDAARRRASDVADRLFENHGDNFDENSSDNNASE